ncbi:MAG: hypothetical protein J0G95_14825 [Rhizobiales bacterium]|nr:hypothetical protein [Hyphomicrobiales bacterium]
MDDDVPLPNSRHFLANDFKRNVNGIVRSVASSAAGMQTTAETETMTSIATEASNVPPRSALRREQYRRMLRPPLRQPSGGNLAAGARVFCPVLRRLPPGRRDQDQNAPVWRRNESAIAGMCQRRGVRSRHCRPEWRGQRQQQIGRIRQPENRPESTGAGRGGDDGAQ